MLVDDEPDLLATTRLMPQNMKIIAKPYDVDELIGMIRNLTQ